MDGLAVVRAPSCDFAMGGRECGAPATCYVVDRLSYAGIPSCTRCGRHELDRWPETYAGPFTREEADVFKVLSL